MVCLYYTGRMPAGNEQKQGKDRMSYSFHPAFCSYRGMRSSSR